MSGSFEVSFNWEVEDGVELPVRVFGNRTPYCPAKTNCADEDSVPAEGGELEDLQVFSGARLPREIEQKMIDDPRFLEAVEAAI